MKNKVTVRNFSLSDINLNGLKKRGLEILEVAGLKGALVEIYIFPPRKMRYFNKVFRKIDRKSSVLSFKEPNIPHPYLKYEPLGEIYLSSCEKKKFPYLLVHSIVHLLGYKHNRRMERKEKEILNKLNL